MKGNLQLALMWRPGSFRGKMAMTIDVKSPTGQVERDKGRVVLDFGGDPDGIGAISVLGPLDIETDEIGVYWFTVRLDGRMVTRIPLRVVDEVVLVGGARA